jgi:hypothetical protein
MTRTGMCWAYSMAASKLARPAVASSSSRHSSRVNGSRASMVLGAKAGSSILRTMAWKGGSEVMGGASPMGAGRSSGPGRRSLTTTERDVKFSVS